MELPPCIQVTHMRAVYSVWPIGYSESQPISNYETSVLGSLKATSDCETVVL